jgi:hypothetical protein
LEILLQTQHWYRLEQSCEGDNTTEVSSYELPYSQRPMLSLTFLSSPACHWMIWWGSHLTLCPTNNTHKLSTVNCLLV